MTMWCAYIVGEGGLGWGLRGVARREQIKRAWWINVHESDLKNANSNVQIKKARWINLHENDYTKLDPYLIPQSFRSFPFHNYESWAWLPMANGHSLWCDILCSFVWFLCGSYLWKYTIQVHIPHDDSQGRRWDCEKLVCGDSRLAVT